MHNPSPDLPSARLVTHGRSRPGPPGKLSGARIWENCPGERARWNRRPRSPRSLGLRWGSYWAEKATSVPGDPGAAQVRPRPRPCRGPAMLQQIGSVLPAVHTPQEGGGTPKRSQGPLCPPPGGLGRSSGTRRIGRGWSGAPYLGETLTLRSLGQSHDPLGLTCGSTKLRGAPRGSCPWLRGCYRGGVQRSNFLHRHHRRRCRRRHPPGAPRTRGACALGRERGAIAPAQRMPGQRWDWRGLWSCGSAAQWRLTFCMSFTPELCIFLRGA